MQLEAELSKPLRILVIAAHPDDIEFGASGSVARWTEAGAQVAYCIVTNGAAGSNEKGVDYVQLAARRREEQITAAKIVGVTDVRFLDYADGILQPTLDLRRDLTRLIRELRADRVVIMDPTVVLLVSENENYINHPDHRAAAEAALYAVFPSAESRPIFPELLEEGWEPHHVEELYLMLTEKPNLAVDITPVYDRKIQALLTHRSQLSEEAADFISKFDRMAGQEAGVEYAETFRVMTFRSNSQPNSQASKDDAAT